MRSGASASPVGHRVPIAPSIASPIWAAGAEGRALLRYREVARDQAAGLAQGAFRAPGSALFVGVVLLLGDLRSGWTTHGFATQGDARRWYRARALDQRGLGYVAYYDPTRSLAPLEESFGPELAVAGEA